METIVSKEFLRAIGISSYLIAGVLVIGGAFFVYKTYLETTYTKLEIARLRREAAKELS